MDRDDIIQRILEHRLIAVVRVDRTEEALRVGRTLAEAGIRLVEITFTVADAPEAIARLSQELPDIVVGAGSITTMDEAQRAIEAGARYLVSPVNFSDMIALCQWHHVVSMVAGLTPTELFQAWRAGSDFVKVFPAGAMGGPSYIRSLLAPLPRLPLVPTGGVSFDNFRDYLAAGAKAVGLGAALVPRELVRTGDWDALRHHAARFVEALALEAR